MCLRICCVFENLLCVFMLQQGKGCVYFMLLQGICHVYLCYCKESVVCIYCYSICVYCCTHRNKRSKHYSSYILLLQASTETSKQAFKQASTATASNFIEVYSSLHLLLHPQAVADMLLYSRMILQYS